MVDICKTIFISAFNFLFSFYFLKSWFPTITLRHTKRCKTWLTWYFNGVLMQQESNTIKNWKHSSVFWETLKLYQSNSLISYIFSSSVIFWILHCFCVPSVHDSHIVFVSNLWIIKLKLSYMLLWIQYIAF